MFNMFKSKEIILPLIVLLMLILTPIWMYTRYYPDYSFHDELYKNGIGKTAVLLNKEIRINENGFLNYFVLDNNENYLFKLGYKTPDNNYVRCNVGVSKDTYYSIGIRDELRIIYSPAITSSCSLQDTVEISRAILLMTLIVAAVIFLISLGFIYYIYKSYSKPSADNLVKPTTALNLESTPECPKCRSMMTEGYMPTVGGVSWRDKYEPIGIPTMLTGLEGTTFWIKRPLLHAYHCKQCKIIIFKYGKGEKQE